MEENKEKIKLNEQDLLDELVTLLQKEQTLTFLCSHFDISGFELLGFIKKLKDRGINITFDEDNKDAKFIINNTPDFTKENIYKIEEDYNETTKIGVIDNLRFGSKQEQISILNEMYKNFAKDGVKYVIVCGNLLEGKYSGNDKVKFGNSLITNDAYGQADHLIKYFPKVEGIKTLFITGQTDHTWNKKLDVGKYISNNREDMIYLGPKSSLIMLNNISIKVESLRKNGEAYTIAYQPQRYSRSLSSYEDYDIILLGGTQTIQDFPILRDSRIFAVPSCVARTPKMVDKYQQNVMGALELEISYTKTGKLKRLLPTTIPYYKPREENYLTIKPLNLKLDEEKNLIDTKINVKSNSELFNNLDKIYKRIKKEESFSSLKNRLEMSDTELYGIIDMLQHYGREIEVVDINNELVVRKTFQKRKHNVVKPPKEELYCDTFGFVSDTHYGSIWCQPSMVNTFVYEGYQRGITDFYHIGDISDGDYSRIRPNHIHEVFLYGATGQLMYTAEHLPKYPGVKWKMICGSHDQTHMFNYGMDFGAELARLRSDVTYLGQDRAFTSIRNCKVELFHPGGGCDRIVSTKPQNGIDQQSSNYKVNMSARGHYHKAYIMDYRNILTLLCGCNVDTSSFMMKNEIPNLMCNYFVTIWQDDNGDIQYYQVEPMIFTQDDVIEKDYLRPKKYIKNKILTLR